MCGENTRFVNSKSGFHFLCSFVAWTAGGQRSSFHSPHPLSLSFSRRAHFISSLLIQYSFAYNFLHGAPLHKFHANRNEQNRKKGRLSRVPVPMEWVANASERNVNDEHEKTNFVSVQNDIFFTLYSKQPSSHFDRRVFCVRFGAFSFLSDAPGSAWQIFLICVRLLLAWAQTANLRSWKRRLGGSLNVSMRNEAPAHR